MLMVKTLLRPPIEPLGSMPRPRLLKWIDRVAQKRFSILAAPAGYGKTILMAQWASELESRGEMSHWITFDSGTYEPADILHCVGAMLGESTSHLSKAKNNSPIESLIAIVCNKLLELRHPVFLFIDNFHMLPAEPLALVMRLVELLPPNAHVIAGARDNSAFPLARLRARGNLLELGVQNLAFSEEESIEFFDRSRVFNREDYSMIFNRTGGWPAGLSLAVSTAERNPALSPESIVLGRTSEIADFFSEEVFGELDDRTKHFLLTTCILKQLSPALCNAVAKITNSRAELKRIEKLGLFLHRNPGEQCNYSYHSLFAEYLFGVLQESDTLTLSVLHRRAAAWLEKNGQLCKALEHEVHSGDPSRVANFLENNCEEMTYAGDIPVIAEHAEHLSKTLLNKQPKVLMTLAWLYTRQLRFGDTEQVLEHAARRIDEMELSKEFSKSKIALMRLMLKHRQTVLATAKDDEMRDVDTESENLIAAFGNSRPYITCTLYSQMLTARCNQYRLKDFGQIEYRARTALARSGYRFATIGLQAALGTGLFLAGQTQEALTALRQALDEANRISGRNSGQAALPALPLSLVLYECDERDAAAKLIKDHLPVARDFGFAEQLYSGYLTLGRLRQSEGDIEGAFKALDEGKRVATECNLERLNLGVSTERIRLWIRNGQPDLAIREGRKEGFDLPIEDVSPHLHSSRQDELRALAWVRLSVCHDRLNEALGVTNKWRHFFASRGAFRALVRWCVLAAQINGVRGDVNAAQRMLREALMYSVEGKFIRSFVDEGPFVQNLIAETYFEMVDAKNPVDVFAHKLLAKFSIPMKMDSDTQEVDETVEDSGMMGALNARELDILRHVSNGLRNREIGTRLGLTEGTVKWYMQQIYDKVGVRRRSQAVERVRLMGGLGQ